MQTINTHTKEILTKSLLNYYETLSEGNLKKLASLMTKESYLTLLNALGFKRSFKDKTFQQTIKKSSEDSTSLEIVEAVLSSDLAKKEERHEIALVSFEAKGPQRVTIHYSQDGHPKKIYFSSASGAWKIDYNAGRKIA